MVFLGFRVVCSVVMALILRRADRSGMNRLGLIRVNYAAAAVIAFLIAATQPQVRIAWSTVWVAAVAGVSYVVALVFWSIAIEQNGVALSIGFTRVSIIIPILISLFVWKEVPRPVQAVGIVLGLTAVLVVGRQAGRVAGLKSTGRNRQLILFALFITSGIAALSSKLFNEFCAPEQNMLFQVLLFVLAFLVSSVLYYVQKQQVDRRTLEWGSLLGAANLGSSVFIVLALGGLAGTIAFPISAALEVALVAILGRVIWKEPLDRLSVVGLVLTVVALVLVQIK